MARMTNKMFQVSKDVIENFQFEVAEELGMAPKVRCEKWACISHCDDSEDIVMIRSSF
ncbi:hypothetical protein [Desulfuribacillus stibiiarsenatis]|uniref:hypothetical protein n=1 Tax=Desulfuribacillus stibiiarsenatis TaxID=1390249 RepID=UPI00159F19F1|nr:hypothetical protein [Desulfuribacillus stibiiarsenatis]